MDKKTIIEIIADMYELKATLISSHIGIDTFQTIQPNTTYSVVEMLIATFADKYKIDIEDVFNFLREREMNKRLTL